MGDQHEDDDNESGGRLVERPAIPDAILDELLGDDPTGARLTGPDGLINELRRRLIERAAGGELTAHLGYPPGTQPAGDQPNRRNGVAGKTLRSGSGSPGGWPTGTSTPTSPT